MVCPDISGCVSQGGTLDEALKNIEEAVELRLDGDAGAIEELKAASLPGRVVAGVEMRLKSYAPGKRGPHTGVGAMLLKSVASWS